jgi:outer membrane protein
MKKRLLVVASIILFAFIPSQLFAQDMAGKFGLGARVGYVNYKGDSIDGDDIDIDDSMVLGINGTYIVSKTFSAELSIDFISDTDIESYISGVKFKAGEASTVPVMIAGRFHIPTDSNVSPYIGLGIGYFFNSFDINSSAFVPGTNIDLDDSFAFQAGLGTEIFFGEMKNISLNFDLKYIWSEADIKITAPTITPTEDEIDLNNFYFGIGIKYFF